MTIKLFWQDPYQMQCTAKVTEINGIRVKLDQTIFYAFSGGQESDEGTIGGIRVVKAEKIGDKETIIDIEHELERAPDFKVGDSVEVAINKDRRLTHMKLHSAIHIAYYFFIEKYGPLKIIGSNISTEKARIDFQTDKPLTELADIQEKLNKFIAEGHSIIRTPDEKSPDLRWWHCGNWKMPCGGTHVANTQEIGSVVLKRKTKGAGKERVEIYLG